MHDTQNINENKNDVQSDVSQIKKDIEIDLELWGKVFKSMRNDQQKRGILLRLFGRTVFRNEDGQWANKRNDAEKASSLHKTQDEANKAAAEMLRNQGGGERTTMSTHGKIVSKDTIAPGNDPCPPKDKEH